MLMAILQVKRLRDDVYAALKVRAADKGVSLSDYVAGVLHRHVELPTVSDWLNELDDLPRRAEDVDVQVLLDDVRATESPA